MRNLSASTRRSVLICLFYACTSVTLSFVNKFVLSRYQFKCPFFLLATQLACLLAICTVVKHMPEHKQPFPLPTLKLETYKKSCAMGCVFVFNVSAGFVALRLVNIPLFLCIRRTTTCFVMLAEFLVLGKAAGGTTVMATLLIGLGAIIAGYSTLSANVIGFTFVGINNVLTALSLTLTRRFSDATGLTAFALLYYNALTALPLSLLMGFVAGEPSTLANFEFLFHPGFLLGVFVSSMLGMVLSYALVLCSTINSPLATSVTGNLKDILSTLLGAVMFGDFHPDATTLAGLATSLTGAMWFSRIKLSAANTPSKDHNSPEGDDDGEIDLEARGARAFSDDEGVLKDPGPSHRRHHNHSQQVRERSSSAELAD